METNGEKITWYTYIFEGEDGRMADVEAVAKIVMAAVVASDSVIIVVTVTAFSIAVAIIAIVVVAGEIEVV